LNDNLLVLHSLFPPLLYKERDGVRLVDFKGIILWSVRLATTNLTQPSSPVKLRTGSCKGEGINKKLKIKN